MFKLHSREYSKIIPFIKSQNELSVFAVIHNIMPGEVYVNSLEKPTAVLIQTSECNLVAGDITDAEFNSRIVEELDFWDQLTPDTPEWSDIIPSIHKNPYIRKYKRCRYILTRDIFKECTVVLKEGFVLEKVDVNVMKKSGYENAEKLLKWVEEWGSIQNFEKYGTGYYIHKDNVIVSWSVSDCSFEKVIAIGINTDERYRKNGLAKMVVSATIKDCFAKGYEKIEWLCVATNKGSRVLAETLGFQFKNEYYSYTSYPPVENLYDLTEAEWCEWGMYLEEASKSQNELWVECLTCYLKSNNIKKTIAFLTAMEQKGAQIDYNRTKEFIYYLQANGLGANFNSQEWSNFFENLYLENEFEK